VGEEKHIRLMVNTRRKWLFFFMDLMSGLMFKEGTDRMIRKVSPFSGEECALPEAPIGWEDMQLTFGRNTHYWGLNRAFSNTFKFVGAGARILRSQLYAGRGTESNIMLIVCKWDDMTGVYRLYYSGQIDFGKDGDQVTEGMTVSTLEGGLAGLIKSMEDSIFEIECDGSIPENVKVNVSGIKFDDVFHYQFVPAAMPTPNVQVMAAIFVSNDGDNIGVEKGNPNFEPRTAGYEQQSANSVISFEETTRYKLTGNITVKSDPDLHNTQFYMYAPTSKTVPVGTGVNNAKGLVGPGTIVNPGTGEWHPDPVILNGQRMFSFEIAGELAPRERLFIMGFNNSSVNPTTVVGGGFDLAFKTKYRDSRVTGMTMWDLFQLVLKRMYAKYLASGGYPFEFDILSDLLRSRLDVVITSGDALRASTDPNYFQYFNQATQNPANPNNQNYNQFPSLGPVIKTNLSDLFDSANPQFNACLGVKRVGNKDVVFLEKKSAIMDSSVITMSLPKVANLKVSVAIDYYFNWIKVGYPEQKYDEKAGKYEYNCAFQWQAPIRSVAKVLELVSKYRADSYGIEYTRYNTQGGKSSTYNESDSSVFMVGTDFSKSIRDFYSAKFTALAPNPAAASYDDIVLIPKQAYQSMTMITFDGEYFTMNIDFSIFMFNQDEPPASRTTRVTFNAILNGLLGDKAKITLFVDGVAFPFMEQAVTGINTPYTYDAPFAQVYGPGTSFYFAVETTGTCTVDINTFIIDIDTGYFTATNAGPINIPASATQRLISLPTITSALVGGLPVVSSGFQYFRFLSNVTNKNFDWTYMAAGYTQGGGSEFVRFDLWKNGQKIGTDTFFGSGALSQFNNLKSVLFTGNIDFEINDIVWMTASPTNLNVYISDGELRFISQIKAYELDREEFDSIAGVPNPETAYNLKFTPGRMIRANGSLITPIISNQAPGTLSFQTADKNPFVVTSKDGVVISERSNIDPHDLDAPLFWPFLLDFDTEVPINFADLLYGQANGHIEVLWGAKKLYGYPVQVTSKPTYNEAQSWKLLLSTRTNLSDLKDLDWDGLIPLQPMDALIPILGPLTWVPLNYTKDPRYNTYYMGEDWYKNRIAEWIENNDKFSPWQWNDLLPLQCQTNGLDPVTIVVLDGDGNQLGAPLSIANVPTTALPTPQKLYQEVKTFQDLKDTLGLIDGQYYFLWKMGIGEAQAVFISEGLDIKEKWPNTVLLEFKSSRNDLGTVFTEGYLGCLRVHAMIGRYTPKSKFTEFADQPQDLDLLGAVGFDTWKFTLGHDEPVPDHIFQKVDRILLLDYVLADGMQITRDAGAAWEQQTFPGEPSIFSSIEVRRAKNTNAVILNTAGQLTDDMSGGYTIDPAAFGQSLDGQDLIQVTND
jgi:hypothetical protein